MAIVTLPTIGPDPASITSAVLNGKVDPLATDYNGNIQNVNIAAGAGIVYSKLTLTDSILYADLNSTALSAITQNLVMSSKILKLAKGADVASVAGAITLGDDGNYFDITGTNAITSITAKTAGTVVTLQFDSTASLVDGSNLKLNGNFTGAAEAQITLVSDGTNWFEVSRNNLSTGVAGLKGHFKKLSSAYASATTWTVTADEVIVNNVSNSQQILRSVNKTINFATTGANALDTGAVAANTIYYIYIIGKADGTIAALASTSATLAADDANMPSGYTYTSGAISCAGTDNSSNLISAVQTNHRYIFNGWATIASGSVGVGSWVAIDLTPANMTTNPGFVPSALSNYCFGTTWDNGNTGLGLSNKNSGALANTEAANKFSSNTSGSQNYWAFDVLTADTLYWTSSNAAQLVRLTGFELNKI